MLTRLDLEIDSSYPREGISEGIMSSDTEEVPSTEHGESTEDTKESSRASPWTSSLGAGLGGSYMRNL